MARPQFKRDGDIDRQLEDLVKAASWKQAIALCEKRIKKGDKSEAAQVAKAHVLLSCPDVVRQQQGIGELERLMGKDPPILDVDVLCSVHMFASYRGEFQDRLGPLWARAAKARPQDDKIVKAWFEFMFNMQRYKEAQEAAITYKTQFPNTHQAHFWYIITCYLLAENKDSETVLRKVNQGLAYGNLTKAANAVTKTDGRSNNGLVLQTLEDLLLLLRVYRSQSKFKEALQVLDDDRTGIFSPFGNKEWQLVRQKIELLELSGQWQDLWQFCRMILTESHPTNILQDSVSSHVAFGRVGDDWATWTGLITAVNQIRNDELFSQAEACIDSFASFSRNARIARLKLYASYPVQRADIKSKFCVACQEYFTDFSTKYVCFLDLSPYLPNLLEEHKVELLRVAEGHTRSTAPRPSDSETRAIHWIASEVNVLKLHYHLLISKYPRNTFKPLLETFVCRCLRLYRLSLKLDMDQPYSERRAGDDAAILATMALIHISYFEEDTALLRCIVILENLLIKSPHNYDALLIMIRLCANFGTLSLAMQRYMQLSIKNMQHATLSWILYTHISLLHPYSSICHSGNSDALANMYMPESLTAALDWHVGAGQINADYTVKMLREDQYNMLFDALTLAKSLKVGFGRLLLLIERARIQRLTGVSSQRNCLQSLGDLSGQIVESRDLKIFPNYEGEIDATFESNLELEIPVDIHWLSRQLQFVNAWDILNESAQINGNFLDNICQWESQLSEQLPESNQRTMRTLLFGVQILKCYKSGQKSAQARSFVTRNLETMASFQDLMAKSINAGIESGKLCTNLRPNTTPPQAAFFRTYFEMFDICHVVKKIVDWTKTLNEDRALLEPKSLLKLCARIMACNRSIALQVEEYALTIQKAIRQECAIRDIVAATFDGQHDQQDLVGMELKILFDQPDIERIAQDLCKSWTEALDGIVRAARYLGSE